MALAGLLFAAAATAQKDAGGRRHTLVFYGMGAAIDGTAGLRDFEVPVDLSISDVFDALEMGTKACRPKGDVDLDQTTLMGTVGRKLTDRLEALFGFAWFDLSTKLVLDGPLATREADADWIDPTLGLARHHPFGYRWRADLRIDVGGSGVGSDLTEQGPLAGITFPF